MYLCAQKIAYSMENNGLNRIKVMLVEKTRLQDGFLRSWAKTLQLCQSGVQTNLNPLLKFYLRLQTY